MVKSQRDAKAALDRELRAACETFIRHCTDAVASPILQQVRAMAPTTAAEGTAAGAAATPAAAASPSDAALDAAVTAAEKAAHGELRDVCALMAAYLPEPSTRMILFAPVRAAIVDALGQLQTLLNAIELTSQRPASIKPERLSALAGVVDALAASEQ